MIRTSVMVGFFGFLSGITGLLLETCIAAKLGLSKSSDTFYVAFTAPYIIANVLSAAGQFSLVPFFASLEARQSEEELWRGVSYAVNMLFLGLSAMAAIGVIAAPWLIGGIAPGFTAIQTRLASKLSQWLFLVIIPAGVAEVFRSFLLSQRHFALPSAAGFFRSATVIVCILLTFNRYGLYSIVIGYGAGYILQAAVLGAQILSSFSVRYSLTLVESGEAFRNLRVSGAAQLASAVTWQGVVVVERIIASFLPPGTLTALNYGFKILTTLAELLAGSVGTAVLPALSQAVARKARAEERKTFQDVLAISLVLVLPAMVFCLGLDSNIVRLIFERGNFTREATALMAKIFFYYSLSLLFYSLVRVLTFVLFARNESQIYFRLTVLLYGLTVAFDLLYVGVLRMGGRGIPLSLLTSLTITLVLAFRRNLVELRRVLDRPLLNFAAKNLLGSALAALALRAMRAWVEAPTTGFENFLFLCKLCGAGSLVFFATLAVSRALPVSRLAEIWQTADEA